MLNAEIAIYVRHQRLKAARLDRCKKATLSQNVIVRFYPVMVFSRPYLRSRYWYSVASVVVVVVVCDVMYCG